MKEIFTIATIKDVKRTRHKFEQISGFPPEIMITFILLITFSLGSLANI